MLFLKNKTIYIFLILLSISCGNSIEKNITKQIPNYDSNNENNSANDDSIESIDGNDDIFTKDENIVGDSNEGIESTEILSKAQFGFFEKGSEINLRELQLNNGVYFTDRENIFLQTINNLGEYYLPLNIKSSYIKLAISAKYFNLTKGKYSEDNLNLTSYSSVNLNNESNINILTTLSQPRIKFLIENKNMSFEDAKYLATHEILKNFNINESIADFNKLGIDDSLEGSSVLLALSLAIQGDLNAIQLNRFIEKISNDIKNDGVIDDLTIFNQICTHTKNLDLISIRENIKSFYHEHYINIFEIPKFEAYLDHDCDGIVNKDDSDTYIFVKKLHSDQFQEMKDYTIAEYENKLWLVNQDGLYSSTDFENWQHHYSKDLSVSKPLMIKWHDLLYIFGGFDCMNLLQYEEEICINTMGVYTVNEDFDLEKIKNRGFGDWANDEWIEEANNYLEPDIDFIEAHLNWDIDDNSYPNYSSDNHTIRIINDQAHLSYNYNGSFFTLNGGINYVSVNLKYGSLGYIYSYDGINWETYDWEFFRDYGGNFLGGFLGQSCDFIYHNGFIYSYTKVHYRDTCELVIFNQNEGRPPGSRQPNRDIPFDIQRPFFIKKHISFTKYQEKIAVSYLDYYNDLKIFIELNDYGSNNYGWINLDIPDSFYSSELVHKALTYNGMIHFITENEVVSIGSFEGYKKYMDLN
jgi:hypothetical protein